MKVALIQLDAGSDKPFNLLKAEQLVLKAAKKRADLICLPEVFVYRGDLSRTAERLSVAEYIPGFSTRKFAKIACDHHVSILLGSIYEKRSGEKKVYNTSILIDNRGNIEAKYRKQHLFRARVGRTDVDESRTFLAGRRFQVAKVQGWSVGLSICFDLRYPELYREYRRRGAEVLCVPASFTYETGQAHWMTLLRARAIENQCYILAPNQIGKDHRGIRYYGHSAVVDPWGKVIAEGSSDREEILYATLDRKLIQSTRQRIKV